jgi:hypothetical protein
MSRKSCLVQTVTAASLVVLCLGLFACSAGSADGPLPASSSPAAAHLIVTDWRNGDDAMLALEHGVLIVQSDGCVGLRTRDPKSKPKLLRWPAGTHLSEDGRAVVGSSGERFAFDTEVEFGGGYGGVPVPSECDSSLWAGVFEVQQPL